MLLYRLQDSRNRGDTVTDSQFVFAGTAFRGGPEAELVERRQPVLGRGDKS